MAIQSDLGSAGFYSEHNRKIDRGNFGVGIDDCRCYPDDHIIRSTNWHPIDYFWLFVIGQKYLLREFFLLTGE